MTITESTATGRRLGARSPRLLTNGTRNRMAMRMTGNTRMTKVSAPAGLRDSRANNHKNGERGKKGVLQYGVAKEGDAGLELFLILLVVRLRIDRLPGGGRGAD